MAAEAVTPPLSRSGSQLGRAEFIGLLAGLMALNALAIDIMLPAFPAIAADYGLTDRNDVQFVLIAYIVSFGVAQIAFGPLSDRFGRRGPLLAGIVIYVVCSAIAGMAPTFGILLAARVAQGFGAAATRIIALSVIRDTHSGRQMASIFSLVMMVFMVVPIVAPATGQVLIMFGHWNLIFFFMAVLATLIGVWTLARLPETLPEERRRPLTFKSVSEAFRLVLTNRLAFCYATATAFFFGTLFGFVSSSEQVFVGVYDLGPWFPLAFSAMASLMAVTSFANSVLVERLGQRRLSHAALIFYFVISILLTGLAWSGPVPFWLFMVLFAMMMPLFGLVGANFNSIAMEPLGAVAGTASAVLGFTQTVGGGLIGAVIGQSFDGSIVPLVTSFTMVSGLALIFVLIGEKGKLFGVGTV